MPGRGGRGFVLGVGLAAPPAPAAGARSGPLRRLEAVRGAEGGAGCFTEKPLAGCVLRRTGVWRTGLLGGLAARVFVPASVPSSVGVRSRRLVSGRGKAASLEVGTRPSGWRPPLHVPFSPSQGMALHPAALLDEIGDPERGGGPLPAPRAPPHPRGLIIFVAALPFERMLCLNSPCEQRCKGRRAVEQPGVPFRASAPIDKSRLAQEPAGIQNKLRMHVCRGSSRPEILKPNFGLWDRCGF